MIVFPRIENSRRIRAIVSTPFIPRPPIRNQDGQSHRNRLKGVKVGRRSPASWGQTCTPKHKIGCTAQTLNEWVKKAEVDSGRKPGLTTDMAAKLKALERENRELRQANEILRKASAYFAQAELDRPFKR